MAKRELNVTITGDVKNIENALGALGSEAAWLVARDAARECASKAHRSGYPDRANQWADAARTLADTAETLQRVG